MGILAFINVFFAIVIGMYFLNLLRQQQAAKFAVNRSSRRELERLSRLRAISLSEPLAEKTRPSRLDDIVGQEEGIRALRAALCGANPQHVIIYGPPGVGKTAAARIVLQEAKGQRQSPFGLGAKFIEVDATTARFDDRGIADPLLGSVHDPIYQGAGPLGVAGIPQPKPGAVTKAHGGVLFIDEIGELHPIQMNKLLKVLEDRKVFLESAYYSEDDRNIPDHIHDIFKNGLPADFRLVGATTRLPRDIPPAVRSRCMEIFFKPLSPDQIGQIAEGAAVKINMKLEKAALDVIRNHADNGRDAVNMVQTAAGLAEADNRWTIDGADAEWVAASGQYNPRLSSRVGDDKSARVGVVNGLGVLGPQVGAVIEVEATATPVENRRGTLMVTGVMEEEELGESGMKLRRKSMARAAVDNVRTVLQHSLHMCPQDYDIHINFPGGTPVDGPSAGVAMVTAVYSAITGRPVRPHVAMTGELSIRGDVRPVGGVGAKIAAAEEAGVSQVIIPEDNVQHRGFGWSDGVHVIGVRRIEQVLKAALQADTAADEGVADVVTASAIGDIG